MYKEKVTAKQSFTAKLPTCVHSDKIKFPKLLTCLSDFTVVGENCYRGRNFINLFTVKIDHI